VNIINANHRTFLLSLVAFYFIPSCIVFGSTPAGKHQKWTFDFDIFL
jgi:hypothetical protein